MGFGGEWKITVRDRGSGGGGDGSKMGTVTEGQNIYTQYLFLFFITH